MSPKYVDKKQRAKEITRAALEVFCQKGYAAASVDQIAATAGIAKGTVYEYYSSKETLYISTVSAYLDELNELLYAKLVSVEDPLRRLISFVSFSVECCSHKNSDSTRMLFEVLQQSILADGIFFSRQHVIKEMIIGYRKHLIDILLEGVSKGVFKPDIAREAETMATNIIAYLDGASIHFLITDNYFSIPNQLSHWMKFLASYILKNPDAYDVDEIFAQMAGR